MHTGHTYSPVKLSPMTERAGRKGDK